MVKLKFWTHLRLLLTIIGVVLCNKIGAYPSGCGQTCSGNTPQNGSESQISGSSAARPLLDEDDINQTSSIVNMSMKNTIQEYETTTDTDNQNTTEPEFTEIDNIKGDESESGMNDGDEDTTDSLTFSNSGSSSQSFSTKVAENVLCEPSPVPMLPSGRPPSSETNNSNVKEPPQSGPSMFIDQFRIKPIAPQNSKPGAGGPQKVPSTSTTEAELIDEEVFDGSLKLTSIKI